MTSSINANGVVTSALQVVPGNGFFVVKTIIFGNPARLKLACLRVNNNLFIAEIIPECIGKNRDLDFLLWRFRINAITNPCGIQCICFGRIFIKISQDAVADKKGIQPVARVLTGGNRLALGKDSGDQKALQ